MGRRPGDRSPGVRRASCNLTISAPIGTAVRLYRRRAPCHPSPCPRARRRRRCRGGGPARDRGGGLVQSGGVAARGRADRRCAPDPGTGPRPAALRADRPGLRTVGARPRRGPRATRPRTLVGVGASARRHAAGLDRSRGPLPGPLHRRRAHAHRALGQHRRGPPPARTRGRLERAPDHHPRRVGRRQGPAARDADLRRRRDGLRAPHGDRERLRPGGLGRHRPGHRPLPPRPQRLERHRLPVPRRPLRPDLRGARRRHRPRRRRRPGPGIQLCLDRHLVHGRVHRHAAGRRRPRLAHPPAGLEAVGPRRPVPGEGHRHLAGRRRPTATATGAGSPCTASPATATATRPAVPGRPSTRSCPRSGRAPTSSPARSPRSPSAPAAPSSPTRTLPSS